MRYFVRVNVLGEIVGKRRGEANGRISDGIQVFEVSEETYIGIGSVFHEDSGPPRWKWNDGSLVQQDDTRQTVRFSGDSLVEDRGNLVSRLTVGDPTTEIRVESVGNPDAKFREIVDVGGRSCAICVKNGFGVLSVPASHPREAKIGSTRFLRVEKPLVVIVSPSRELGELEV